MEADTDDVDINDYELPEDEIPYTHYVDILNIYNVYFKTLFHKNHESNLFDSINNDDPTSTNRAMEKLYEEIDRDNKSADQKFTKFFKPDEYKSMYLHDGQKLTEGYPFYMINIGNDQYVTHSLITALVNIAKTDWHNLYWSINQINEF